MARTEISVFGISQLIGRLYRRRCGFRRNPSVIYGKGTRVCVELDRTSTITPLPSYNMTSCGSGLPGTNARAKF